MTLGTELEWQPRSWSCPTINPLEQITIEAVYGIGGVRYAVRRPGHCLSNRALSFDYEPMPSQRSEEWLSEHRMASLEEAKRVFGYWVDSIGGEGQSELFRACPLTPRDR